MTPSPQLENYFASGGTSGFQARDRANAELAQLRANTAQTGVQTQGLDIDNQLKQQAIRDTIAANRAWMGWDGKNPNDLISGVLRNGGSVAAANDLQTKILDNQKKKLGITADQLNTDKTRHDLLAGKVQTILAAPPDQQQALYDQYKGQIGGLLDQGEQLPDQFPGTAALTAIKNAHLLESQQNENALKQQQQRETAARAQELEDKNAGKQPVQPSEATKTITTAEGVFQFDPQTKAYSTRIGDPPKHLENQSETDQEGNVRTRTFNPTTGEYGPWVNQGKIGKPNQQITVANQVGGDALDLMAQQYINGKFTSRNAMLVSKVAGRAAQMLKGMGLDAQSAIMEQNAAKASQEAYQSVTKQYETLKPFAEMAEKNADILEQKSKEVSSLGGSFLNTPVRELEAKFGSAKVAAYKAALLPVQADFARILNSPTASGELSDNARHEMQGAIGPGATPQQIKAALDVFRKDAKNRKASYEQALSDLKGKTVVGGSSNSSNAGNAGGIPANVKAVLDKVGPGIHTLSDGSKWMKDASGNITKQ